MLTLRVPSHHYNRRVSRCCETQQKDADQTTADCRFIKINDEMEELFRVVGMSDLEVAEDPMYNNSTEGEARSVVSEAKKKLDELHFTPVRQAFMARCI
jgi:hypothetical protein